MIKSSNIFEKLQDAKNKYAIAKYKHDTLMSNLKEEAKGWLADKTNYTFYRAFSFCECYHYTPYGFSNYDLRFQNNVSKNQSAYIFKHTNNVELNHCYGFICYLEDIKSTLPIHKMWLFSCKNKGYKESLQKFTDEHSNEKLMDLFEEYVTTYRSPFYEKVEYFDIITNKSIKVKDVVIFKTKYHFEKYSLFN